MNNSFKNINIEEVLFFDLEVVRKSENLDINSKEFELYQKKIRDRSTDELPTTEETVEHYKKFAALKMNYNKVVCATVGRVVDSILYLRSYVGQESEVLKGLYSKFQGMKYISGFNVLEYDCVMARVNSLQYEGVSELIPEQFNDSNKKSWDLKGILDLMNVFKGTHWANPSLDEVCYHLGIKSPKEGDIEGSQVSEIYYKEGVEKIEAYCKKDVFAVVNLFCRLQGKPQFADYIDANAAENSMPVEKELSVLERLYQTNSFSAEIKKELEKTLKKKKITDKDKEGIKEIVLAVYIRDDFENNQQDGKKVIESKTQEVEEWLKTL